jgi:Ni,Fe-hydrogenase maturation factor
LLDGYDTTILVDACPRGEPAGTLYVIEPDLNDFNLNGSGTGRAAGCGGSSQHKPIECVAPCDIDGRPLKRVLLVGCEPATLGPEEGQMGLSATVEAVVDEAVKLVESLVSKIHG